MTIPLRTVLIFPGTTLVGLEILRSLEYLPGFFVHGAGVDVPAGHEAGFSRYHHLPHIDHEDFPFEIRALLARHSIDYLYPANDVAISVLSRLDLLGQVVISHPLATIRIAGSKIATHSEFAAIKISPNRFVSEPEDSAFPIFSKPDIGHSSIGAQIVRDKAALEALVALHGNFWGTHLVTELLVSDEVTVDCFSTAAQGLLFAAPRTRDIAEGGVAVVTTDYEDKELTDMAALINTRLTFNGPWFFQAKRNVNGNFRLMEIGARLAGASGIRRAQGVNLAQLAILASDNLSVSVYSTRFTFVSRLVNGITEVESDECFVALYVDLDDTLILNGKVNKPVEALTRYVKGLGLYVAIVTRHRSDPSRTLKTFNLDGIFDEVIHVTNGELKSSFIGKGVNSVLIDDSFSERISSISRKNILAVDASSANQLRKLFHAD